MHSLCHKRPKNRYNHSRIIMTAIQNIELDMINPLQSNDNNTSRSSNFSNVLNHHAVSGQDSIRHNIVNPIQKENHSISLGTINTQKSSVAHLLLSNPDLKSNTWSIIHNPINSNKDFKQIPVGQEIIYNTSTGELSWNKENSKSTEIITAQTSKNPQPPLPLESDNKILLGTLDKQSSTVSELLSSHTDFKSQRWNIIFSDTNKHKPFTKIPEGSQVYIDNKSKEITWISPGSSSPASDNTRIMTHKLDDAVKPFIGTAYDSIDCYTLVVHGLKNMGINYQGEGSLSLQLLQMARAEGRADNTYFNGEGITQAIGEKVYSKSIIRPHNIQQQSQDIYHEMKALMQKGDILSFSLESKGHTGVISQNQNQWTFINSGRLDHSINKEAPKNGVGEESLVDEINNWIKLAQEKKESLKITIGRLDTQKLV